MRSSLLDYAFSVLTLYKTAAGLRVKSSTISFLLLRADYKVNSIL